MPTTDNIWTFADKKVANKGVWARMGHSARMHSTRSAINSKGSLGSKALSGLGAITRATFSMIPLPIIGSLLTSAHSAVEKSIKTYVHKKNTTDARTVGGVQVMDSDATNVKFQLKDISVENLDRYRYKVTDSLNEAQAANIAYPAAAIKALAEHKRCHADLELALKLAQAERRILKFEMEVAGLLAILNASMEWAKASRVSLESLRNPQTQHFARVVAAEKALIDNAAPDKKAEAKTNMIAAGHLNCSDFCHHGENAIDTTWDKIREGCASTVNILQAPFSADSFLTTNYSSYVVKDQMENYSAPAPPAAPQVVIVRVPV